MKVEKIDIEPKFIPGSLVVHYYEDTIRGSDVTKRVAVVSTVRNIIIERTLDGVKIFYKLDAAGDQGSSYNVEECHLWRFGSVISL